MFERLKLESAKRNFFTLASEENTLAQGLNAIRLKTVDKNGRKNTSPMKTVFLKFRTDHPLEFCAVFFLLRVQIPIEGYGWEKQKKES